MITFTIQQQNLKNMIITNSIVHEKKEHHLNKNQYRPLPSILTGTKILLKIK